MGNVATRLLSLILLLQTRPSWKAAELALELNVSERTIHRYMAMLEEMGIPIRWGGDWDSDTEVKDQRFDDLGCMGNKIIQTPNLDKLAADGVIFNNAFVTTAICCSSRASILTGQHMRRHRIYDFATPLSSEAMDNTYPVLLRKSGYRTGFLGKMAIGKPSEEVRHLSLPAGLAFTAADTLLPLT